jgi:hypothetical protein
MPAKQKPPTENANQPGQAIASAAGYQLGGLYQNAKNGKIAKLIGCWATPQGNLRFQFQPQLERDFITSNASSWQPLDDRALAFPLQASDLVTLEGDLEAEICDFAYFLSEAGQIQTLLWCQFAGGDRQAIPLEAIAGSLLSCDIFGKPADGWVRWRSHPRNAGWLEDFKIKSNDKTYYYTYYRYEVIVDEYRVCTPAIRTTLRGAAYVQELIEKGLAPPDILARRRYWASAMQEKK